MRKAVDTVAAIATPPGEGAIGVIRLSGPEAISIAGRLFRGTRGKRLEEVESHRLVHGRLVRRDPDSGEELILDEVLVAVMRGPRSYTGEDVVEISCHGSVVVLERVMEALLAEGAAPAPPGEFTRRAFMNGRIDLAQAEAVIDLVRARSPRGAEVAAAQLAGRLSEAVRGIKAEVLNLAAHLQVVIDYPEEGIEELGQAEFEARVERAIGRLDELVRSAGAGRVLREGIRLAITGRPNVGKSSLLNALLREPRAIVTNVPGTTRDVIEERAILGGVGFTLVDTAGVRETGDVVERIGVERAKEAVRSADLVVAVFDGSEPLSAEDEEVIRLLRGDQGTDPFAGRGAPAGCGGESDEGPRVLAVVNKADLPQKLDVGALKAVLSGIRLVRLVKVSALTGDGLAELEGAAVEAALGGEPPRGDAVLVTRARHRRALERAREALLAAREAWRSGMTADLISVDLQESLEALAEITGENVTEALIEEIFSEFCVGK